jgi:hypothetical protein
MTHDLHHRSWGHALREQERSAGTAQVMEPLSAKSSSGEQTLE